MGDFISFLVIDFLDRKTTKHDIFPGTENPKEYIVFFKKKTLDKRYVSSNMKCNEISCT